MPAPDSPDVSRPAGRASERVARLTDALFGGSGEGASDDVAWGRRYVIVTAVLVSIIVARRSDMLTNPQFFAEDGLVFFPDNMLFGFPGAVARLYAGFPQLAHRLIAWLGGLVPVLFAPRVYVTSAVLLTALAMATFALPSFRHLVRSDALRVLFAVLVVTLPVDEEVLGTPTNLGWYLAIWLSLTAVMRVPRPPWRAGAVALAAAVAAMSTPLAVVALPLWGWRLVRAVIRSDRVEGLFVVLPLLSLASALALTPSLGVRAATFLGHPVSTTPASFRAHSSVRAAAFIVPPARLRAMRADEPIAMDGLALGMAVALLSLAALDRRTIPALLLAFYLFVASLWVILYGRPVLNLLDPLSLPARYAVYPGAAICLAIVAALDAVPRGRGRIAAVVALSLLVLWARHASFFLPHFADLRWDQHAARLERGLRDRCPVQLRVPLNPLRAPMDLIWGPRYPESAKPGPDVVASFGGAGIFAQAFDSRCDNLSDVELYLRPSAAADAGRLRLDLYRADGGALVGSASLARAGLAPGWNAFCFPPIAGSQGARYVAVFQALDGDPSTPLAVLGAAGAGPTDERAWFAGRFLDGNASLVHGCIDREVPTVPIVKALVGG